MKMVLLQDDRLFWSERMLEHMIFIYMYISDTRIKQVAKSFYMKWKNAHNLDDLELISLMGETLEFQNQLQVLLDEGKWIGSFFPKWMKHITEELEYAIDKVAGNDISDEEEILFWDDVVNDHASLDARMLDPSERSLINTATAIQDKAQNIINMSTSIPDNQLLQQSLMVINSIIQFHESAKRDPPLSIIHPLLLNHVYEEERRGREILRIIASRNK